jgi:hypothetical protein
MKQNLSQDWVWWLTPVIAATQQVKAGRPWFDASLAKISKTLSQNQVNPRPKKRKKKKKNIYIYIYIYQK